MPAIGFQVRRCKQKMNWAQWRMETNYCHTQTLVRCTHKCSEGYESVRCKQMPEAALCPSFLDILSDLSRRTINAGRIFQTNLSLPRSFLMVKATALSHDLEKKWITEYSGKRSRKEGNEQRRKRPAAGHVAHHAPGVCGRIVTLCTSVCHVKMWDNT